MHARKLPPASAPATCPAPAAGFGGPAVGTAGCDAPADPPRERRLPEPVPAPLVAERPDGVAYAGDLARDVVRYRRLRARTLAGDMLTAADLDAILSLESRLRQRVEDGEACGLRTFQRFACTFETLLVHVDAERGLVREAIATAEDMSAGGLKVRCDLDVVPGDAVDVVLRTDPHTLVRFPSRVAWVGDGVFGVMFAGSPRDEAC